MPNGRVVRPLRICTALVAFAVALVASGTLSGLSIAQEAELDSAEDRLDVLQGDLAAIIDRYDELTAELESVRGRMAVIELRVRDLAQGQIDLQKRAVVIAQELYKGGSIAQLETVLSADTISEIQTHLKYLESSGQAGTEVFGKLATDRLELEDRLDELDDIREGTLEAVAEMEDLRAEIADRVTTQKEEIAELDAELAERAVKVVSSPPPAVAVSAPVPSPSSEADWDAIAMCESGQRWHLDSTYDGGLQFHPDTWLAYGGGQYARYAWQATREQQIAIAEKVLDGQGPGAWPNCFVWK